MEDSEQRDEPEPEDGTISIAPGSFVCVKFRDRKNNTIIYSGLVLFIEENEIEVTYMKKLPGKILQFSWPDKVDRSWIDVSDCICELPAPDMVNGRNSYTFDGYEQKLQTILKKNKYQLK